MERGNRGIGRQYRSSLVQERISQVKEEGGARFPVRSYFGPLFFIFCKIASKLSFITDQDSRLRRDAQRQWVGLIRQELRLLSSIQTVVHTLVGAPFLYVKPPPAFRPAACSTSIVVGFNNTVPNANPNSSWQGKDWKGGAFLSGS